MRQDADVAALVGGEWSTGPASISSIDPTIGSVVATAPSSVWPEIDRAIESGVEAYERLSEKGPERIARFLEAFALQIDLKSIQLAHAASQETGLPKTTRLWGVELPRTVSQLRKAAVAARDRSWKRPTIDRETNIRSMLTSLHGPVVTFGPINFPLAFSSIAGGDAAAALATGHPVIAKAHPAHIRTSAILTDCARDAVFEADLPLATVQVMYNIEASDGQRLVSDPRIAATAFTGGRETGLNLKRAADVAGVPIFLEMSSLNPIVVLPKAMSLRAEEIASSIVESVNLSVGQFCTKPGMIFAVGDYSRLETALVRKFESAPSGPMISSHLRSALNNSIVRIQELGAESIAVGKTSESPTDTAAQLLRISAAAFLSNPHGYQLEMFGPASLLITCSDVGEALSCLASLEGSLSGALFSEADDPFDAVMAVLEHKLGRIAMNKPPTGVQVVASMNHGGPYPATGNPYFSSVGIPRSLERFAKLTCYDGARDDQLPAELQDANPLDLVREVDGAFTEAPL